MPNLLKNLRINTIGSVDKPANQESVVVLCKRDDSEDQACQVTEKGDEKQDLDKGEVAKVGRKISNTRLSLLKQIQALLAELITETEVVADSGMQKNQRRDDSVAITEDVLKSSSSDTRAYIAELEKKANSVDALVAKVAELEKGIETKEEPVDIWKGVHPDIRKQFEDMQKKADDAERVAKTEREKREWSELVKRASVYPNVGAAEEVAALLKHAYEGSAEQGKQLEAVFKATNERIAQGDLFREVGRSSSNLVTGSGAWAKIEAKAAGLVEKSGSMTKEQAIAKILELEPQLYTEYENERLSKGVI